jgi:16S rRNA (guanine527-N7)-methyltransferase
MRSIIGKIIEREAKLIGLFLSEHEINSFELYASELKKWNNKINLTNITSDREIAIKHFADSLIIAPYITANDSILDIGSGAGLPVIPLKIIMPEIKMVSVDAVTKKILFQRHIIRTLKLTNIDTIHARIEELHKSHPNSFSVITSRAFTSLDRFITLAAPLLAEGGVLIAMKGEQANDVIAVSDENNYSGNFTVVRIHPYTLSQNMGERTLIFLKQDKHT